MAQINPQFTFEQHKSIYFIFTLMAFIPQYIFVIILYFNSSSNLIYTIILGTFLGLISSIYVSTHILQQSKVPNPSIIFIVFPVIFLILLQIPTISYPFQTELFLFSLGYLSTLSIFSGWNLAAYKTEIAFRKIDDILELKVKYFRYFNVKNETFKIDNGSNIRIKKSNILTSTHSLFNYFIYLEVLETTEKIPIMPFNQNGLEVLGKIQSIFADTNCNVRCDVKIFRNSNLFLRILQPQPVILRMRDQNNSNKRVELKLGDIIFNRSKYKPVKPTSYWKIILTMFVGVLYLCFNAILIIISIAGVIITYQKGWYPLTVFLLISVIIGLPFIYMVFSKAIITPILVVFGKHKIINQNNSIELYSELFSVKSQKIIVPKVLNPYITENGENMYLEFQEFHIKYKVRIAKNLLIKEYQLLR